MYCLIFVTYGTQEIMPKKIKITPTFLKKIEDMASKCATQKDIATFFGFSEPVFRHNQNIRDAWLKGNAGLKIKAMGKYSEHLLSDSPDAFKYHKHFQATQMGIVEPKEEKIVIQKDYDLTDEQALKIADIVKGKGDAS